jgi:hypothetical protein
MTKPVILEVVNLIKEELESLTNRSRSIPAVLQCLFAIRFFASGQLQFDTGDLVGLSQPSVSRIVKREALALATKAVAFIKFPQEQERQSSNQGRFL